MNTIDVNDPSFVLSPEQQTIFNEIKSGKNVVWMGKGGIGKSVLIKYLRRYFDDQKLEVAYTAATWVPARTFGGESFDHFLGIGLVTKDTKDSDLIELARKKKKLQVKHGELNVLIYDEIYYGSREVFEKKMLFLRWARYFYQQSLSGNDISNVNNAGRGRGGSYRGRGRGASARGSDKSGPLGSHGFPGFGSAGSTSTASSAGTSEGKTILDRSKALSAEQLKNLFSSGPAGPPDRIPSLQILGFGDPLQLGPIDSANYVCESPIFKATFDVELTSLGKSQRHSKDPEFADLLDRVRVGRPLPEDVKKLQSMDITNSLSKLSQPEFVKWLVESHATCIETHRAEVAKKNGLVISSLAGPAYHYTGNFGYITLQSRDAAKTVLLNLYSTNTKCATGVGASGGANDAAPDIATITYVGSSDSDFPADLASKGIIKYKMNTLKNRSSCDEKVTLKVGAEVLLIESIDRAQGLTNGLRGIIQGFVKDVKQDAGDTNTDGDTNSSGTGESTLANNSNQAWPIIKFNDLPTPKVIRPFTTFEPLQDYPNTTKRGLKNYTFIAYKQLPIIPAYALTCHRAQGATLSKVIFNCSGIWEPGQFYTGTSRVRESKDCNFIGFKEKFISANTKMVAYNDEIVSRTLARSAAGAAKGASVTNAASAARDALGPKLIDGSKGTEGPKLIDGSKGTNGPPGGPPV